jgi:adenosylmethionine-8-amino-7-oxononanoate aminotransferase
VALASLDLTESEETWASIARITARHEEFRKRILDGHPLTSRVRQQGTILAFDLTPGGEQGSYFAGIRDTIYHHFLDLGILLRPLGNTVYILPPYCITDEQLDQIYAGIQALLEREWS